MLKAIVKLVIALISQPAKTWVMLKERWDNFGKDADSDRYEFFLKNFLHPFIGILTIAAFVSVCTRQEFEIEYALKSSILTFVSTFGGFYLTSYLVNEIWKGVFKKEDSLQLCQIFVGFSSALMFTLDLIWLLLPDFFFLYIFILYTFYIVWEGSVTFMAVEDNIRMKFTTIISLLIICIPQLIEKVLIILMPGLR